MQDWRLDSVTWINGLKLDIFFSIFRFYFPYQLTFMLKLLAPQYSFKNSLVRLHLPPAPLMVTSAVPGLPFDLMEAADGSSNKSRLLVKEPIARKAEISRAVLHRDSCYLLWHGLWALSGGDGRLRLESSSGPPPQPSSSPCVPPSPSLVSFTPWSHIGQVPDGLEGFDIPLAFSAYQASTAVLCALAKLHYSSVPRCPHALCCWKKRRKSLSRLHVCMWEAKRITKWFKHQEAGASHLQLTAHQTAVYGKEKNLGTSLPVQQLRQCASQYGGKGSFPAQGINSTCLSVR